jgi:hypothetical protein
MGVRIRTLAAAALLCVVDLLCRTAAAQDTASPRGQFRLKFDNAGITSLKYGGDKYDTDYTGTAESNYGFWYPGRENDGGAGSAYVAQAFGSNWFGKSQPRGAWQYSGEIDLGFGGGLRGAACIVADDPVFGNMAYGGELKKSGRSAGRNAELAAGALASLGGTRGSGPIGHPDQGVRRTSYTNELSISGLSAGGCEVLVDGRLEAKIAGDHKVRIPVSGARTAVVVRASK